MKDPITNYWKLRLEKVKGQLENNDFEVFLADDVSEAKRLVLEEIIPASGASSISYGGSMTMKAAGIQDALLEVEGIELLRPDDPKLNNDEKMEIRRKGLLVDLYFSGTNALTEDGTLVNLDMIGNRVGAITYGPRQVVILVGRNKLVPDLDSAMYRIKDYAAPVNTMRLNFKTPCAKTGECEDCSSPMRICNSWTITEKSFPKKRIKIILINQDLGY